MRQIQQQAEEFRQLEERLVLKIQAENKAKEALRDRRRKFRKESPYYSIIEIKIDNMFMELTDLYELIMFKHKYGQLSEEARDDLLDRFRDRDPLLYAAQEDAWDNRPMTWYGRLVRLLKLVRD